ncbi:hypothetical protein D3H65_19360 [Paraflavitalea soli]|uniref:Uncharacterized protein n=1 Tax=Paraflavitalea soli TaxID=2315862 RepID=A0A3B7MQD4_9BACT|nr:hypothetical protein [Paraflavitalea soli]AXY76007.1 hypothetical protein D3H65_19360 [Paraflavitalea soli]
MSVKSIFPRFFVLNVTLFSLLVLISCQKDKSFESGNGGGAGSGGTSVFTLVPTGGNCSDAMTTGTFVVGTAVAATDFVIVTVDVSKAGTWSYNTGTVNGLSFSGSGTFAATGNQVITLQATGTPTTAENTTFPLNIGGVTCNFVIVVNPVGGNPAPGDPYYKATIAGVNYMETVTATNDYEAGFSLAGVDDVIIGAGINYSGTTLPAGYTTFGVETGIKHGYYNATDAQFKAFFTVGTQPFAAPAPIDRPFDNGDGFVIYWTDKQGNNWSSSHPTLGQPAGSSFKVVSVDDGTDLAGTYYVKVKMQFNCTLYKVGGTETVTLTNGEMLGFFGKI